MGSASCPVRPLCLRPAAPRHPSASTGGTPHRPTPHLSINVPIRRTNSVTNDMRSQTNDIFRNGMSVRATLMSGEVGSAENASQSRSTMRSDGVEKCDFRASERSLLKVGEHRSAENRASQAHMGALSIGSVKTPPAQGMAGGVSRMLSGTGIALNCQGTDDAIADEPSLDGSACHRLSPDHSDQTPLRIDRSTTGARPAPGGIRDRPTAHP